MTRRFTSEIINEIGPEKDIPAPDVGTDAKRDGLDLRHLLDEQGPLGARRRHRQAAHRSAARSAGWRRPRGARSTASARRCGRRSCSSPDLRGRGAGVRQRRQHLARFLAEEGAKVIAISDSRGGLHNPNGIDVVAAIAHKQETGSLAGLTGAEEITNEELLLLDCDVLAPCALEQVITHDNAAEVKAKIVCEGANGPITPAADEILEEKGVLDPARRPRQRGRRRRLVLRVGSGPPGVLLEGARGELEAARHRHARVQRDVARVRGASRRRMRIAAYGLAVGRVAEATVTRGLYPRAGDASRRLYHGAGCHLCERALAQVRGLARGARVRARGGRHRRRPRARGRATASLSPSSRSTASGPSPTTCHEAAFRRRLGAAQTSS